MKQIKNLFSKLTKFFVKPMVLPVMLLFTSFGFGLRPVHAKSNQIEQSFTVSGKQQPLSSTKALELLIKNQEFFDNQKLSKKNIKVNKLCIVRNNWIAYFDLVKQIAPYDQFPSNYYTNS
jgi:hypothetical protein